MTENLTKLPIKSILRKSSLTFIEHDDSEIEISLDMEKPTKVIVEPPPLEVPPKEYPGETEDEKARREEFELKRKMNRHQEAMKVAIAKKLLSQEDNIEEERDINTEDDASETSEDALENTRPEDDNDYFYPSADDTTEDDKEQNTNSKV